MFWLEPEVILARSLGLDARALRRVERLMIKREDLIENAWQQHFSR